MKLEKFIPARRLDTSVQRLDTHAPPESAPSAECCDLSALIATTSPHSALPRMARSLQRWLGMDLKVFPKSELETLLRALRAVAVSNDAFTAAERDFLHSVARIHGFGVNVDTLEPIDFDELARAVVDPHRRKRAVQLAIVMAFVEGPPSEPTLKSVQALASALEISEQGLRVLYDMSHGHSLLARFEMGRRMRAFVKNVPDFPGFGKLAMSLVGVGGEDPALAQRYRALEACPKGSFGRALFDHFTQNGFAFPGEKHGVGAMVFHDVGHVLSGYSVEPEGEIQQAAFQAGFTRHDGFLFLLFGILQFHVGLRITPVAKGQHGLFDVNAVLRAAERGAACRVDLGDRFDHFAYANMPLSEVRERLGVPPQ
jgi:hypothetical protein